MIFFKKILKIIKNNIFHQKNKKTIKINKNQTGNWGRGSWGQLFFLSSSRSQTPCGRGSGRAFWDDGGRVLGQGQGYGAGQHLVSKVLLHARTNDASSHRVLFGLIHIWILLRFWFVDLFWFIRVFWWCCFTFELYEAMWSIAWEALWFLFTTW